METVDTQRMRRVLARIQGGGETKAAASGGTPDLLAGEETARRLILSAAEKSPACDRALSGPFRRCCARGRELRARRFLAGEGPMPEGRPRRGPPGVLSALRELYIQLKGLENAYRDAGAEALAGECHADADAVDALLARAL